MNFKPSDIMFSLTSKYGQPPHFLTTLTERHQLYVDDNSLQLKKVMAEGFFKTAKLNNNIHCLCSVYDTHEDFHLYKIPLSTEFFVLRIDEISPHGNSLKPDYRYNYEAGGNKHSVLLMSSLEEFNFFAPKDSAIKTLEILMPRIWFFSQLHMECSYGLLKKYMDIKTRKSMIDFSNDSFKNSLLILLTRQIKRYLILIMFTKK